MRHAPAIDYRLHAYQIANRMVGAQRGQAAEQRMKEAACLDNLERLDMGGWAALCAVLERRARKQSASSRWNDPKWRLELA